MIWLYAVGFTVVIIGASAFFGAPYLPSRRRDLKRMFDNLVPLKPADVVLDLGSGDGLVLREVSRRGAKAVGFEIHPILFFISKLLSWGDGKVSVKLANIWLTPFPDDVTLVYIFSVGRDGGRVVNKLNKEANRLKKPLKLVCYGNALPGVKPIKQYEAYWLYEFRPLHLKKP